jgi:hypothetical protein
MILAEPASQPPALMLLTGKGGAAAKGAAVAQALLKHSNATWLPSEARSSAAIMQYCSPCFSGARS